MSTTGGRYEIGPQRGELLLHTSRQGLAAQAGHDLTIVVDRWSGAIVVADEPTESTVDVTLQMGTLRVLSGSGGVKPLSNRDKREIATTARRLLDADRQPEARFVSQRIEITSAGGVIHGELTLRGQTRPVELTVDDLGDGRYRGRCTVAQSEFGIKPFTAFFGALKLADEVGVSVELDLSEPMS